MVATSQLIGTVAPQALASKEENCLLAILLRFLSEVWTFCMLSVGFPWGELGKTMILTVLSLSVLRLGTCVCCCTIQICMIMPVAK